MILSCRSINRGCIGEYLSALLIFKSPRGGSGSRRAESMAAITTDANTKAWVIKVPGRDL